MRVGVVIALPLWTVAAVFFIGGALASIIFFAAMNQLGFDNSGERGLVLAVLSVLVYVIGLGVLLIEPYAWQRLTRARLATLLGVARRPVMRDAGMAFLAWAGYFMAVMAVVAAMAALMPTVLEQAQDIGFRPDGALSEKIYAGLIVVIAAPLVEELVFRGYLQGSLRRYLPWWGAGIITSLAFGAVHGQLNVGIDTFVLSLVACYFRERTGAIWAGVGLHAIKNGLAYYLLFWAPPWLLRLLGGS